MATAEKGKHLGPDLPWYQWWPGAFRLSSERRGLGEVAELAYRRLLDRSWELEGAGLPSSSEHLAKLAGLPRRRWDRIEKQVMGCFVLTVGPDLRYKDRDAQEGLPAGRYFHPRLEDQRATASERQSKRRSCGAAGGRKRAENQRRKKSDRSVTNPGPVKVSVDLKLPDLQAGLEAPIEGELKLSQGEASRGAGTDGEGDEELRERPSDAIVHTEDAGGAGEPAPEISTPAAQEVAAEDRDAIRKQTAEWVVLPNRLGGPGRTGGTSTHRPGGAPPTWTAPDGTMVGPGRLYETRQDFERWQGEAAATTALLVAQGQIMGARKREKEEPAVGKVHYSANCARCTERFSTEDRTETVCQSCNQERERLGLDPEGQAQQQFSRGLSELSLPEASRLIDHLKGLSPDGQ